MWVWSTTVLCVILAAVAATATPHLWFFCLRVFCCCCRRYTATSLSRRQIVDEHTTIRRRRQHCENNKQQQNTEWQPPRSERKPVNVSKKIRCTHFFTFFPSPLIPRHNSRFRNRIYANLYPPFRIALGVVSLRTIVNSICFVYRKNKSRVKMKMTMNRRKYRVERVLRLS